MPLQVEYREKYSAFGRFPGGFTKREGKASDYEILTCRLVDRALRPLFPDNYHAEVYVNIILFSADGVDMPDALAGLAASAALAVSDIPFGGPISEVRVARKPDSEYGKRLERLTGNIKEVDGMKVNFGVYEVVDVNAFACGDGSVRICAGLMDVMTDEEVMAVIGHEIGHVIHTDSKDAMKNAYFRSAVKNAAGAASSQVAKLTDSELGAMAEALEGLISFFSSLRPAPLIFPGLNQHSPYICAPRTKKPASDDSIIIRQATFYTYFLYILSFPRTS